MAYLDPNQAGQTADAAAVSPGLDAGAIPRRIRGMAGVAVAVIALLTVAVALQDSLIFRVLAAAAAALVLIAALRRGVRRIDQSWQITLNEAKRAADMLDVTLRSIGDAVIATDADGRVRFLNLTAESLTGWKTAEANGRPLEEVFHIISERTGEKAEDPVGKVLRSGRVEGLANATALIARDGTRRSIADSGAPIRDAGGAIVGAILVFRDVTEERAAQALAERLAAIVANSDDAIVGKNLEGTITSWNRGAERLYGFTAEEMIGQPIYRIVPKERHPEEQDILATLRRGERIEHFETVRLRKDGTPVEVSLTVSPIRDKEGMIVGASKTARDITVLRAADRKLKAHAADLERAVAERTAELRATNERLQELDRLKSQFLAAMSHELRTPLNSIIGFTEIIVAELAGPLNPEQKKQLNMVLGSGRHLLSLINDLLDLARIESGRAAAFLEEFELGDVIGHVASTLAPSVGQKGLAFKVATTGNTRLRSDRKMVYQILLNLANNAVKFTESGGVTVTAEEAGDDVRIAVSDTGIGIKPENLAQLFEAFRQLDGSAQRRYEGTGLGLHLSRRLARLLGGTIEVVSEYGRGSTFTVTLPKQAKGVAAK